MVIESSGSALPRFPVSLYGSDWGERSFADAVEMASVVEFVDDDDPPYLALDAEGEVLRIIAWNVEVLVCHRLGEGDVGRRAIAGHRIEGGGVAYVERAGDVVSRALVMRYGQVLAVLPGAWDEPFSVATTGEPTAPPEARDFHVTWMKARTRQRRWP